ncbi:MAG: phosphonate C-P lyase system protein PhnH [Bradyrhizobium sp.]|nr:phosphonate C-P lyase system protein PhnH [Bradyrhizobium sp.]
MVTFAELPPGFADKVLSAQSTFRSVMDAMARPGTVQRIRPVAGTPGQLMRGTAAIALTLFDHDTPVWLDAAMSATPQVAKWLKFHTSAPVIADTSICSFAVVGDAEQLPPLDRFALGSSEYPDRSTTIILQTYGFTSGPAYELTGPGIDGTAVLQAKIPTSLLEQFAANEALFPRGIDVVLVHDDAIVAIPRTTRLAAYGA